MRYLRPRHCPPPMFPYWVYEFNALAQQPYIPYEGPCINRCCQGGWECDDSYLDIEEGSRDLQFDYIPEDYA